jgi:hemin uptake protein HemP
MRTPSNPFFRPADPAPQEKVPCIKSHELMLNQRTIEIDHGGQRYTLRVTRENKLILTK